MGDDEYSLRLLGLGESGGLQMLEPWLAALLVVVGFAFIVWSLWRARRMLLELIAEAA